MGACLLALGWYTLLAKSGEEPSRAGQPPAAGVGALLALLYFKTELSMIALIGIILLIGIVKKNAVVMIDFALDAERKEGKTPEAAIYEACLLRFRLIMMTTLAAMFGALPLALGTGVGSELRRPLGIAIVDGLLVSQLLTLYTTPVIYLYLYLDRLRLRFSRMSSGHETGRPLPQSPHLPDVQGRAPLQGVVELRDG